MKKFIPLIIILSVTLTSCIEIIEEITLNKDQSGSISYSLETNELGYLLNNFTNLFDVSIENHLKDKFEELASGLKNKQGINNVDLSIDKRSGSYGLMCDFSNSKDFNSALYEIFGYKKNLFTPGYIKVSKHKFKRINFAPWVKKYFEKEDIQIPAEEVLEMITYKTIINLPDEVKSVKNKTTKLSNNRKTVTQSYKAIDIINNKANVRSRIKF